MKPFERTPARPAPWPPLAGPLGHEAVPVGGDRAQSLASIATLRGVNSAQLIQHNFRTNDFNEVNWYLREYVGCFNLTVDGKNYLLFGAGSRSDVGNPAKARGKIFVPRDPVSWKPTATVATYKIGPATRPLIPVDNGFLDVCTVHSPGWRDWMTRAAGGVGSALYCAPGNLKEACDAYDHFLNGRGSKWTIAYQNYPKQDASGATTVRNAIQEAQNTVETLALGSLSSRETPFLFEFTGTAIACGARSKLFPYPATENWQKAIGAHHIWLSGTVEVEQGAEGWQFRVQLKIHAEDRYNFNPGAKDIKTGMKDQLNGRL